MNHTENIGYEAVLKIVSRWPTARQITLVEDVLKTISSRVTMPKQRQRTLERALGLLATDKPAPTDEVVKQWLNERRTEKYQ